jgi:signal transduction histidine kinase
VLISAYFTETEYRVQGLESGADAYLIEPISDAELSATLRAVARRLEQLQTARHNERLLDALFEYIPEGITVADAPDVRIRRISRFGVELTGRPRDTLEAISADEHPEKWAILRADGVTPASPGDLPLTRSVLSGAVITDEEWVLRRPDGQHVTILCSAGPIRDAAGRVTGGVIAWRDITARKETEEALRRLTAELRRADEAKNDFLATVVHEVRQPIQAALAGLGVMKTRATRRAGERAREVVERQLHQIARITEDLLDATRIVRREVPLRLQPLDLCAVLRQSLETVRPAAATRELQLLGHVPAQPIPVRADAVRLEQVFVNLLSNAVRYTGSGGTIDLSVEALPDSAVVRVQDTGDGIAPEHLTRIFDLFVRGSSHPGGFGIGLSVARSLVESHGGTLTARSAGPGHGSEFTVRLPTAPSAETVPAPLDRLKGAGNNTAFPDR